MRIFTGFGAAAVGDGAVSLALFELGYFVEMILEIEEGIGD